MLSPKSFQFGCFFQSVKEKFKKNKFCFATLEGVSISWIRTPIKISDFFLVYLLKVSSHLERGRHLIERLFFKLVNFLVFCYGKQFYVSSNNLFFFFCIHRKFPFPFQKLSTSSIIHIVMDGFLAFSTLYF